MKNKTYAVIDIGTLKVKFLIASLDPNGEIVEKYKSSTLTCFGCDIDSNNGFVYERNIIKTIEELKRCKRLLAKYQVVKTKVVSTHAMRRAENREEIMRRIKKEVGFEIENISQEKEAELFFNAAIQDFPRERDYAVLDIGGGSVQILLGNASKLKRTHMMQSGAQYLHDNFTTGSGNKLSFTKEEDIEVMKQHILEQLMPFEKEAQIPIIYGSTNIIDLMKFVKLPLEEHNDSSAHPYKTYAKHLEEFIQKMLPLNYSEREKMYEFEKGYMWGIDKAFLNVITIAEHFDSPYIVPTNANVAKGIVYSLHD